MQYLKIMKRSNNRRLWRPRRSLSKHTSSGGFQPPQHVTPTENCTTFLLTTIETIIANHTVSIFNICSPLCKSWEMINNGKCLLRCKQVGNFYYLCTIKTKI
mgnify:CR=1 FL=1